jgi:hypothetical protein
METVTTSAHGAAVRLGVGAALLAAIEDVGGRTIVCRMSTAGNADVQICVDAGRAVQIAQETVDAVAEYGVRIETGETGITIVLPRIAAG